MNIAILITAACLLLGLEAQASKPSLCTPDSKFLIQAKDENTIRRISFQFNQLTKKHKQILTELNMELSTQNTIQKMAVQLQDVIRANEPGAPDIKTMNTKDPLTDAQDLKVDQFKILRIANEYSQVSAQIQELIPCLQLSIKTLRIHR